MKNDLTKRKQRPNKYKNISISGFATGSDFYPHTGIAQSGVPDIAFNHVSTYRQGESPESRRSIVKKQSIGTDMMLFSQAPN